MIRAISRVVWLLSLVILCGGLKIVPQEETTFFATQNRKETLTIPATSDMAKLVSWPIPYEEIITSKAIGWKQPWAIAFDSRDNLYVLDKMDRCIYVFKSDGKPIRKLPEPIDKSGLLKEPTALFINDLDEIYVTEGTDGRVLVLNSQGQLVREISISRDKKVIKIRPVAITQDTEYSLYLIDFFSGSILVADFAGLIKNEWSLPQYSSGQSAQPSAIAVGRFNKLFVLDTSNHALFITDPYGKILYKEEDIYSGPAALKFPSDLALAPKGHIFIADTGNFRIQVRDSNLRLLTCFQWFEKTGMPEIEPFRLDFDSQHNLYFLDRLKSRVIKLPYTLINELLRRSEK